MTPLQRHTLAYLATVDSATPEEIRKLGRYWNTAGTAREHMRRIIANGHARNISTTRRCLYRITLEGRQAIALESGKLRRVSREESDAIAVEWAARIVAEQNGANDA